MNAIALHKVNVTYTTSAGASVRALSDISLSVDKGQSVAVVGPSGCGKSSLLRVICGLQAPDGQAGRLVVRKNTALITQDYGLLPWKTAEANVELGLKLSRVGKKERKERTVEALAQVGLAEFAHSYPRELSGGMQQRLALARAIASDANMLLMDEPLSALDALLREEMQEAILSLWQQRQHTQIIVTHAIEEAVFLGQRIVIMSPRPGRIVCTLDNPGCGSPGYRESGEYFEQCLTVRRLLSGEQQ